MNELQTQVTGLPVLDSQMAQSSWREMTSTNVQMFAWFTNVTVLPDEDLRVKTLHVGCAKMSCFFFFQIKIARKKKYCIHNAVEAVF